MSRNLLYSFAAILCIGTLSFVGCGGGGGEAVAPETTAVTAEEEQEMADYEAEQDKYSKMQQSASE
jgi:hypothetical protein